jgi:hypothetical protein
MKAGSSPGERLVAQPVRLFAEASGDLGSALAAAGLPGSADYFVRGGIGDIPAEGLHRLRGRYFFLSKTSLNNDSLPLLSM